MITSASERFTALPGALGQETPGGPTHAPVGKAPPPTNTQARGNTQPNIIGTHNAGNRALHEHPGCRSTADPAWTLTTGPAAAPRYPESLTPDLADIPQIIAVTHHAATALEAAAAAGHDQLQAAARAERLLVPARSLPRSDSTRPFTPAPRDRVRDLLFTYRTAGQATADAATTLGVLAARSAAPSRALTTRAALTPEPARPWHHGPGTIPDWQGPLETSIRDLGVTSPWLLQRAIALDQASTQLLLDAAAEPAKRTARKRRASPDARASAPVQEPHAGPPAGPADREPEP